VASYRLGSSLFWGRDTARVSNDPNRSYVCRKIGLVGPFT
jgi:hypothetical protein